MPPSITVLRPAIRVCVRWSASIPMIGFAAMFTVVGIELGWPLALAAVVGGVGGAVSLLFHELGHVRAASRIESVRPVAVTLSWAGAATALEGRYRTGRDQARVAIGGPQASFAFAVSLCAVSLMPGPLPVRAPLFLLAFLNFGLGLVNLVPVYPLDGYKIVQGMLWSVTGSETRASRILRRVGIGWAAIEAPAVLFLLVEKPIVGALAVGIGLTLLAQKRLMHHVAH